MDSTSAPPQPPAAPAAAPDAPPADAPPAPDHKRRKLGLQVSIETGADGKAPIHQVFADGSYLPALDSHFERTSAAASAFVARALAAPPPGTASVETNATDSFDAASRWSVKAVTSIEGALYELWRALSVIEALRAATPVLELKRTVPRAVRVGEPPSESVARESEGMLVAKRRLMNASADLLDDRVKAMHKWVRADNAFCDAFLTMRKKCNGVRRRVDGMPLIDVGDGEFTPVFRPKERRNSHAERAVSESEELRVSPRPPWINFPAATFLQFGINALDDDPSVCTAPVMLDPDRGADEQMMSSVIRSVRLSRVASFRRRTFEQIAKEAAGRPILTELTTNAVALESGPNDLVRIQKTQRAGSAPALDAGTDPSAAVVEDMAALQNASLLQVVATHSCLKQALDVERSKPGNILDRVLAATSSRSVVSGTEKVLDEAVQMLRVRVEWTRGVTRVEESRARVFSTSADGDGPDRPLATFEPISNLSNGGNEGHNGHVRVTPAFGVIMPAPDDPSMRGRAVTPHSHSSSSGAASSAMGLDDVPRSYVCPVDGEILSVLALLLCIRLLDALEDAARAGEPEMLDVDRQCFTVIVSAPSNGHTLKAKVWPRGPAVGAEVPGSVAWFNGTKIQSFPVDGPGRVAAWKLLLRKLVSGDIECNAPEEKPTKEAVETGTEGLQDGGKKEHVSMDVDNAAPRDAPQPPVSAAKPVPQAGQFPFRQAQPDHANQFQFDL